MKKTVSLRVRITLICAALLAICCILLTISNNLSAVRMMDQIHLVPIASAQTAEAADLVPETDWMPVTEATPVLQQAQRVFHAQSLLAMAAILGIGLLLIYHLVGKALAPLRQLSAQIQDRTVQDLAQPLSVPNSGDEVMELARSFNELSQRLDRAFVMQRSFSQNAAHEFRTPLAVLKTRVGLFRKKRDFAPQATEAFLGILESEVDRLSGMVDSLLKLTNLEQVPRTDRIGLEELLDQVREDGALLAADKGVAISVDAVPCALVGSRELLRRALFNLVENAVKYGPEGGQVWLRGELEGTEAVITVADQGPGIPPELRERIFEPFFRVDTARSRELGGTGLGLALVRAIVECHGGKAEALSGGGGCFCIRLPALDGTSG
jgi:signal transduction histidine kinase